MERFKAKRNPQIPVRYSDGQKRCTVFVRYLSNSMIFIVLVAIINLELDRLEELNWRKGYMESR